MTVILIIVLALLIYLLGRKVYFLITKKQSKGIWQLLDLIGKLSVCPRERAGFKCHKYSANHDFVCDEHHFLGIGQSRNQ